MSLTDAGPVLDVPSSRGEEAARWTLTLPHRGYEALTILAGGEVLSTSGFPAVA